MPETKLEIFSTEELQTKGDKARGVAKLGQHLSETQGIDKNIAGDVAAHELQHSLKDTGPGKFTSGYIVDEKSGRFKRISTYTPSRKMSDEEYLQILEAPRRKSKMDLEEIKRLKKPFWKKLLSM